MYDRRKFLRLATTAGAFVATQRFGARAFASKSDRPRYVVLILLAGGHDTVYTTDPKTRSEVRKDIHIPQKNRIVEKSGLRFGPHLAPLASHADGLSFLNGVTVATANHDTGFMQYARLKTNVDVSTPSVLDVIGARRDGQPMPVVYLGASQRVVHSPAFFGSADQFYFGGETLLDATERASGEELELLGKTLAKHAKSLKARGASERQAQTIAYLEQAAAWFRRVPELPIFEKKMVANDYVSQSMSEHLQRTVWLLQNDLTACVFVEAGLLGWDTHINNEPRQAEMTGNFVTHFQAFLDAMRDTKNRHGSLLDQTAIVVGSDLGRFPMLNDMLGKDHLPQTAFMFAGKGFEKAASFGRTGDHMEALPIALASGGPAKKAGHTPILDDVGTTLLHLSGLAPERFGYNGRVLEFLLS